MKMPYSRSTIAAMIVVAGVVVAHASNFTITSSTSGSSAPFEKAGFAMANASTFGRFRTHRRRDTSYTTAIDNIFVKGFDILDAWTDENSMLLSDHRVLLCRLRPKASDTILSRQTLLRRGS